MAEIINFFLFGKKRKKKKTEVAKSSIWKLNKLKIVFFLIFLGDTI